VLNTPEQLMQIIVVKLVILVNLSNETFVIQNGERIAQLIIAKHERADWIEVQELSETSRGEGGFGSTGVK
jgi:dUTP pyrophosphatase